AHSRDQFERTEETFLEFAKLAAEFSDRRCHFLEGLKTDATDRAKTLGNVVDFLRERGDAIIGGFDFFVKVRRLHCKQDGEWTHGLNLKVSRRSVRFPCWPLR